MTSHACLKKLGITDSHAAISCWHETKLRHAREREICVHQFGLNVLRLRSVYLLSKPRSCHRCRYARLSVVHAHIVRIDQINALTPERVRLCIAADIRIEHITLRVAQIVHRPHRLGPVPHVALPP